MRLLLSRLSGQGELSTSFCRKIIKFFDFLINNQCVTLRFVQKHGNITKNYSDLKEIQNFCMSMDLINFMYDKKRMYTLIPPPKNVRLYYIHILVEILAVHMKIKAVGFSPRLIKFLRDAYPVNVPFTFRSKINLKNLQYSYYIDNKSSPKEQILQKLFALMAIRCLISKKQGRYYKSSGFPYSRIFATAELLEEKFYRLMVLFRSFLEAYDKFELDDCDKIISISMELDEEYDNELHRLEILENPKRSILRLEPIARAWIDYPKNYIAKRFHIKTTNIKKTIEHLLGPDDMPDDNKILRYKQIENQLLIPI